MREPSIAWFERRDLDLREEMLRVDRRDGTRVLLHVTCRRCEATWLFKAAKDGCMSTGSYFALVDHVAEHDQLLGVARDG